MRFTVFTPTYNRAYILENLYRSLQAQSFHDFEWLVIDDGSTDNTKELFNRWLQESNPFPIRYYYYPNCGKPREINRALDLAAGELFFTVDSDDILTENALKLADSWEKSLPKNVKYCAIAGSDGDMQKNPTNPIFEEPFVDATFFQRDPNCSKFIGYDRPWIFYTDIHRKYRYPEFENERFITEAVAWNRMAHDGYWVRCFNDVCYLWEHQEEGYTSTIADTLAANPNGYGLWQKELMEFSSFTPIQRFRTYYWFYCDLNTKFSLKEIAGFIGAPDWQMVLVSWIYKMKRR